jgi:hypothetical protein
MILAVLAHPTKEAEGTGEKLSGTPTFAVFEPITMSSCCWGDHRWKVGSSGISEGDARSRVAGRSRVFPWKAGWFAV